MRSGQPIIVPIRLLVVILKQLLKIINDKRDKNTNLLRELCSALVYLPALANTRALVIILMRPHKAVYLEMDKSKSIAAIVGPTLIVMPLSELKLWNPTLYETQIVPLIYLSGVLMFIAGLIIVHRHNFWFWGWQTILTIIGWFSILLGLIRMFFPEMYKAQFKNSNSALIVELSLILIGIFLTYQAY